MKLAEALLLRADFKKQLASLRERIARNAVVQEGEQPKEPVPALLAQAHAVLAQQQQLVRRIHAANETCTVSDGRVLADVLGERERLVQQHALLTSTIEAAHRGVDRYSQREIKWVSQVDVAGLQKMVDDLARRIREINAVVQAANWSIEL